MDESSPVNEAVKHGAPHHHEHGAHHAHEHGAPTSRPPRPPGGSALSALKVPVAIVAGAAAVLLGGGLLYLRAAAATNHVALAAKPKGVTVVEAHAATFRGSRRYVASIEPWLRASVGPQLVAAYVDTVLVRPGAAVKRGDVLATLDCRNTSAGSSEVAMRARALEAKQTALAKEAARVSSLLKGGFVSANEAEQKDAETASMEAQLLATKAKLVSTSLEVNDCVLRAPFDGEIAVRLVDPGAFVRPGQSIVSIVDRSTVRVSADVPEGDFEAVSPGVDVRIRMLANGGETHAAIARRAPSADPSTRTIHFEVDLPDPERKIPVGTSAELKVEFGQAQPSAQIPLAAAQVRGSKATVFLINGDQAHLVTAGVRGEDAGRIFLDPAAVPPGAHVVLEGRALLNEGDKVEAGMAPEEKPTAEKPAAEKPAAEKPAAAKGTP